MKVFLVKELSIVECNVEVNEVQVFDTFEKAQECFVAKLEGNDMPLYAEENGWDVEVDSPTCFEGGAEGRWSEDSYRLSIEEKDVE